jgi:hypothetical protein
MNLTFLFLGKYPEEEVDQTGDTDQDQEGRRKKIHDKFHRIVQMK